MKPRLRFWLSSASLAAALVAGPVAASSVEDGRLRPASKLEEALLTISVNGMSVGEPVAVLRGASGKLYVPSDLLTSWRFRPSIGPAFTRGGVTYHLLNNIPGLRLALDEASQSLDLNARPAAIEMTRIAYADLDPTDRVTGGKGAFMNYDAAAQLTDGDTSLDATMEAGIFSRLGVGLTNFVTRWSGKAVDLTRLATNWTIDDPAKMRSLRFGDSISRGGVGGAPIHFGGIQLARNFSVQPGFVTIPLPSLRGSAAVPSIVDIYVNEALAGSRDVPPGPFEISNVPIVTGNGEVQLVVRDLLGRQTLYSQSYYATPQLLAKGLHDYSFEAGFLRRNFGRRSNDYGALMVSGTYRYGFTDTLTGETHAVATPHAQSAGVAGSVVVSGIGQVQGSIAGSRSKLGDGALAGFSLERRSGGLSLRLQGEWTTSDYKVIGSDEGRRAPASTIQAFAGVPLGSGSVGLSYLRRDSRGEPDVEFVSASASLRLGPIGNLHFGARKSLRGNRDTGAELLLTMPLGNRRSSTAGASLTNGSLSANAVHQRDLPVGNGWGYRVSTASGALKRIDGRVSLRTGFGTYDAHVSRARGSTGLRLSASGGLGLLDGHAFASRQLNQSFATVKVGDYANVRVYADNQLIGRTNGRGIAVIPRLRPFDRNTLRIEIADLPWEAELDGAERTVRPFNRHGVAIDFAVKPARAAIIRILLDDGTPLPAGATVRIGHHPAEFVSAPGGEVYVTGLEAVNTALVVWSAGSCRLHFRFPDTGEVQPLLGDFLCPSGRRPQPMLRSAAR